MAEAKSYDKGYKEQAVKLAKEIGNKKASGELGVPYSTLYGWIRAAESGDLDMEECTPENAMSLAEENRQLRKSNKELAKENKRMKMRATNGVLMEWKCKGNNRYREDGN